ncbi:MAG: ROK family protein [Lachnospiraceae bacterium]|nr:ROK family protein [Lachnospiraceae bacterium]
MNILTLDAGGTAMKYACFHDNEILCQGERPSGSARGAEVFSGNMKAILCECLRKYPADAIGISTTGQVDAQNGSILYADDVMPGYTGMKLKEIFEAEFSLPVHIENDVNAAAIGEGTYGAGKGYPDFLMAAYGTGIGGAVMAGGTLLRGSRQAAGEFGHIRIHPGGRPCGCGGRGCYETCASATALVRNAIELDPSLTDGRKIFAAFNRGEAKVKTLVEEWVREISYGLISLIYIFNPSRILLGGGIFEQPYPVTRLREIIAGEIQKSFLPVDLIPAALGNLAGVYGMKAICCDDYPPCCPAAVSV